MYFAIFATDRPDSTDLRLQTRPAHREYLRDIAAHPEVTVIHGGPTLAEDEETMNGSMMIVEAPSLAVAQAFSAGDPYRQAGLFAVCEVRPWAWVLGRPDERD
ncbi:MAG: YciI family protein [Proteobacteria bacterium]|nr:YciI family protein [Pseudomonadota bacterium]MDA1355329.1 YciI family protein [Pseudomonadota bacterium]